MYIYGTGRHKCRTCNPVCRTGSPEYTYMTDSSYVYGIGRHKCRTCNPVCRTGSPEYI